MGKAEKKEREIKTPSFALALGTVLVLVALIVVGTNGIRRGSASDVLYRLAACNRCKLVSGAQL